MAESVHNLCHSTNKGKVILTGMFCLYVFVFSTFTGGRTRTSYNIKVVSLPWAYPAVHSFPTCCGGDVLGRFFLALFFLIIPNILFDRGLSSPVKSIA